MQINITQLNKSFYPSVANIDIPSGRRAVNVMLIANEVTREIYYDYNIIPYGQPIIGAATLLLPSRTRLPATMDEVVAFNPAALQFVAFEP